MPPMLEAPAKAAQGADATRGEVLEATLIAAVLRTGSAATHGTMGLKFFDQQAGQKKE